MMRKDFEAIAAAIWEIRYQYAWSDEAPQRVAIDNVARAIADVYTKSIARFDRDQFLQACGV
jgi:hypothetical protein